MSNNKEWEEEFVEKGADIEHDRWARWHKYSRLMATPKNIEMWDRKAEMPYTALTNEEQESDRKEARNYIPLIKQLLQKERQRICEESELRGIAKILDNLWENSANERDMSKRIEKELIYFFGKNWSKDMYEFAGIKGARAELPKPLHQCNTKDK